GAAIGVSLASKHGSDSPAVTPATAPSGGATTTPIPSPGSGTTPTTVPASGSGASAPALSGAALDVKGILAKVEPSVVDIVAQSRRGTGEGTGIIISPDGYILTNAHVVNGANTVTVSTSSSGKALSATVIGADTAHDVALIKVADLVAGGPAAKGGIAVGDLIVSFDGKPVATADALSGLVQAHQPGDTVQVVVERNGASRTVSVTLGTKPAN